MEEKKLEKQHRFAVNMILKNLSFKTAFGLPGISKFPPPLFYHYKCVYLLLVIPCSSLSCECHVYYGHTK